jgi:hypothetical protein
MIAATTLEPLVDRTIQVGAELTMVDTHSGRHQSREFVAGNECSTTGSNRAKLGQWLTVARDDESFTRGYRFDHFGGLVAQFA